MSNAFLPFTLTFLVTLIAAGAGAQDMDVRDAESALSVFKRLYRSDEPGDRVGALKVLAPYEGEKLIRAARDVITNDTVSDVQNAAIKVLGHWGSPEAAAALLEACGSGKLTTPSLDLAGDTLGAFYDDEARKLARQVLKAAHSDVRYVSTRALGHYQTTADLDVLAQRLEDGEAGVRLQAARSLGELGDRATGAMDLIVAAFQKERDAGVRVHMIELIAKTRHPSGLPLLTAAADDDNIAVACTALKCLGAYPESFDILRGRITDTNHARGAAAVRGIAGTQKPALLPVLFDCLEQAHPRVQGEILYVLGKMTGKKIGPYADAWRGWWTEHQSEVTLHWDAPYNEGQDEEADGEAAADEDPGEATVSFFGLELHTKNVVFVMDTSRSMLGTSYDKGLIGDDGQKEERPYIERVKSELMKAIQKLPSDVRFNVYFFDTSPRKLFAQMTPATKANVTKAIQKTKAQQATGNGTNFFEALKAVWDEDGEIDTVVFLSDGAPTEGQITDPLIMLEWIRESNRVRNCCFNTISVGYPDEHLDAVMSGMAVMSGGRYVRK